MPEYKIRVQAVCLKDIDVIAPSLEIAHKSAQEYLGDEIYFSSLELLDFSTEDTTHVTGERIVDAKIEARPSTPDGYDGYDVIYDVADD